MPQQFQPNILNMTLGQVLQNNPAAQNIIMQSMNLTPVQFQQLLNQAESNQMMNMTFGELFKNGTMTQAMQMNPQQLQQMVTNPNPQSMQIPMQAVPVVLGKIDPNTGQMIPLNNGDMQNLQNTAVAPQNIPIQNPIPIQTPKPTFFQKLKDLFK